MLGKNDHPTEITVTSGIEKKTVDLYSQEGLELVGQLWVKAYAQARLTHEVSWMGIPIIQFPEDVCMMQEILWKVRPDVIVECGIAHGGSLVFYAAQMELIGKGKVIGVDVEIRHHNRLAISNHMMTHRIELIEGSSIAPQTIELVKEKIKGARKVMVILDSNHSTEHVAEELELYSAMVTEGSYMIAMDGAQAYVWDIPNAKPGWKDDNPLIAIEKFVKKDKRFVIDEHYTRLKVTSNPKGYLRRLTVEEMAGQKEKT
jgi:cephalosporin hydroxylase